MPGPFAFFGARWHISWGAWIAYALVKFKISPFGADAESMPSARTVRANSRDHTIKGRLGVSKAGRSGCRRGSLSVGTDRLLRLRVALSGLRRGYG